MSPEQADTGWLPSDIGTDRQLQVMPVDLSEASDSSTAETSVAVI